LAERAQLPVPSDHARRKHRPAGGQGAWVVVHGTYRGSAGAATGKRLNRPRVLP
jgi:hypothetical protein